MIDPFVAIKPAPKFLRMKHLVEVTGLSRAYIYRLAQEGRFPKSFEIVKGSKAIAWLESEVVDWMEERLKERSKPVREGTPSSESIFGVKGIDY